jgi:DNA-binding NtrC family response regulator/predicted ATPase
MEPLAELRGQSAPMVALRKQVLQLLKSWSASRRPPPVLIEGETGTGKGLLARSLGRASPRAAGPFIDVNCAAIPEALLEAELFGFQRGAFTGAGQAKPGLFQLAHHGTLFLDEVLLLPLALQGKLLSALEERAVRRLGATTSEPVDIWVLSATNEHLADALRTRRFREDLYHRLAVVTLELPPLRARGRDILLLAEHFLARACLDYGLPQKTLAPDAQAALAAYPWPGNVRELSNAVERAALLSEGAVIPEALLALGSAAPGSERGAAPPGPVAPAMPSSRDVMRDHLLAALTDSGWNISRTATLLGVSRNTVMARIARFGLRNPSTGGSKRLHRPLGPSAVPESTPPVREPRAQPRWESRRIALLLIRLVPSGDDAPARHLPEALGDKVRSFGGRVEALSPTALFAAFGVDPVDEPAVLATHTALAVRNMAKEAASAGWSLRVGLHAGEILVRLGSGPPTLDADASSEAWNRLQDLVLAAESATVVATSQAGALLRHRFSLIASERFSSGYQVEGLWHAESGERSDRPRLVGRREELALLENRMQTTARGRGQVVDIAGEAGIGKSRLLLELAESAKMHGVTAVEGHCLPVPANIPFHPILAIVRRVCGIDDADAPEVVGAKIETTLREVGPEAADLAPELGRLLADEEPSAAPILGAQTQLSVTIRRLLLGRSEVTPLLVLVEDLQWADPSSEACLASMIDAVVGARIFLVTTHRSNYRPPWIGRAHVTQLPLGPLSAEDSLAMVRSVLQADTVPDDLAKLVLARADGNPLFLEELSRAALERGESDPLDGVPATLEGVIGARLGELRGRARQVFKVASVIGRDVPVPVLREVTGLSDDVLDETLAALQRGDLIHERAAGGSERVYVFKHALVQSVAYARVPADERRALHARVLEASEKVYPARGAEQAEWRAHHAVLGDVRELAVPYLLRAGSKAVARSAHREALTHLTKGLQLVGTLPDDPQRDRLELDIQSVLAPILMAVQGYAAPEVERAHARALDLCRLVGDSRRLVSVHRGQFTFDLTRARYRTARELVGKLRELAEFDRDAALLLEASMSAGLVALFMGEFEPASDHFAQGVALYEGSAIGTRGTLIEMTVTCMAYLGRVLWFRGYPDQALQRSEQALSLARENQRALSIAQAMGLLTNVHQVRGDLDQTREWVERTLAYSVERGFPYWTALARILQSWSRGVQGPDAEAIEHIRRGLERYEATGARLGQSWFLALLGEMYGRIGDATEGLAALAKAEKLITETGEGYYEAEIHRLAGDLRLQQGGPAAASEAEVSYRRAIEVARRQGARGWELRAATSLARMWRSHGKAAEGREILRPVYAAFTEGLETRDLRAARELLDATD